MPVEDFEPEGFKLVCEEMTQEGWSRQYANDSTSRIQRLTGCRPQDVCLLRPCDSDQRKNIWSDAPSRHRTEHGQRSRIIFLGSKPQPILAKYLLRLEDSCCFSPAEIVNGPGRRSSKTKFDRFHHREAIQRACRKAGVARWSPNSSSQCCYAATRAGRPGDCSSSAQ